MATGSVGREDSSEHLEAQALLCRHGGALGGLLLGLALKAVTRMAVHMVGPSREAKEREQK